MAARRTLFTSESVPPVTRVVEARGREVPVTGALIDAGADCLSIDKAASLVKAGEAVGELVRLMVNVHPSEIMLQGSASDVRRAAFGCLAQAGDNPKGYVVASVCSLPTETPFANIQAMLDAVTEAGWPISPKLLRGAA